MERIGLKEILGFFRNKGKGTFHGRDYGVVQIRSVKQLCVCGQPLGKEPCCWEGVPRVGAEEHWGPCWVLETEQTRTR